MNPSRNQSILLNVLLSLSLFFALPLFTAAQNDKKPAPVAPKPKPAAPHPAQNRAPQKPPTAPGQRPITPAGGQRPGTVGTTKPNTPGARPNNTPGSRPGTTPGTKPGASTTPGARPGTVASGPNGPHPAGNRPTTPATAPNGGRVVTTPAGHTLQYNKTGQLNRVVTSRGTEAHYDARGHVHSITTPGGTRIIHGPGGQRQLVTVRADHSRVVTYGHTRFVEHRSVDRGGRPYMRRTYVYGGRTYVNVYRGRPYRGVVYYGYVPAYYYRPAYYGWAYNPWGAPVHYAWGWNNAAWYGPYGYYFTPYPVYPSAAFWLTDYLVAENLRAAYEAQAAANANAAAAMQAQSADASAPPPPNNAVTLTPEVKQMIADEVKAQLAAEQASAQSAPGAATPTSVAPPAVVDEPPSALDPKVRVFIVTTSLDVAAADGETCSLNPGDVLTRSETTPDDQNTVAVNVASSQRNDCATGSTTRVQVADLQDMHNQFREKLDSGLKTLADNQGKNGIPAGPSGNTVDNPDYKQLPTSPDLSASVDLKKQEEDADQSEQDVQQAAPPTGSKK